MLQVCHFRRFGCACSMDSAVSFSIRSPGYRLQFVERLRVLRTSIWDRRPAVWQETARLGSSVTAILAMTRCESIRDRRCSSRCIHIPRPYAASSAKSWRHILTVHRHYCKSGSWLCQKMTISTLWRNPGWPLDSWLHPVLRARAWLKTEHRQRTLPLCPMASICNVSSPRFQAIDLEKTDRYAFCL